MPAISPEHAAAMVVRGLVEKPARIDTPAGTLADFGTYFTPKLSRRVLHQMYLGYPDSAAARGVLPAVEPEADRPARRPKRPARSSVAKMRMPGPIKRAVRLVPGVHW
jgi:MoxR-like ATPase